MNFYQQGYPSNGYQRMNYQTPNMPVYSNTGQQNYTPYPQMQAETFQGRFVDSKEEAYAFSPAPGVPVFLKNRMNGQAYYKYVDPNTGAVDFKCYVEEQIRMENAPQYVTMEMLLNYQKDIDRRFDEMKKHLKGEDQGV